MHGLLKILRTYIIFVFSAKLWKDSSSFWRRHVVQFKYLKKMIIGKLLYIFSNKHRKVKPSDALVKKIFCMPRVIVVHRSGLWERRRNEANTKKTYIRLLISLANVGENVWIYNKKSFYTSSILHQDSFALWSQINRDNIEPK